MDFKQFTNDQKLEREEATKINKLRESFLRAMKSSADFSALEEHGKPYIEAVLGLLSGIDKSTVFMLVKYHAIDALNFETTWKSVMSPGIRVGLDGRTEKPFFQITNIIHELVFSIMVH